MARKPSSEGILRAPRLLRNFASGEGISAFSGVVSVVSEGIEISSDPGLRTAIAFYTDPKSWCSDSYFLTRRWCVLGMRMSSRYLATVRRVT